MKATKVTAGIYKMEAYGPTAKPYLISKSKTAGLWLASQNGSLVASCRTLRGVEEKINAINHRDRLAAGGV